MVKRIKLEKFRLPVHEAIQRIRYALGWSKDHMAREVGIGKELWWQYEKGRVLISLRTIERVRDITGIDPYMLAYCLYYDGSKLPEPVRKLLAELKSEWEKQIEIMRVCRQRLPGDW